MDHVIRQYGLEEGALEVQYIEENFSEFRHKKTADEIIARLTNREYLILLSMAELDDSGEMVPVGFKVGHELRENEPYPPLAEIVRQLSGCVDLSSRRVFYSWIGGTRREWRGKGHYRALTEQQEEWAHDGGYHELVVKTKNRFYPMRATLDHLEFNVVRFQPDLENNRESKLYLSKRLGAQLLKGHRTARRVSDTA
jgi:GNAT superfamily N-acetyltransferase